MTPDPADDDVRAPLVIQIAQLRRRVAWLESLLDGGSAETAGAAEAGPLDVAGLLAEDPDSDATIRAFLEHVRADARLEAMTELAGQQVEAMTEFLASERSLASVAATVEEIRAAAERTSHAPAVREALAWAVRQLERALIASGPVVEEAVEAERERVLAAAVEVLGLQGLAAAEWVAAVNERVDMGAAGDLDDEPERTSATPPGAEDR